MKRLRWLSDQLWSCEVSGRYWLSVGPWTSQPPRLSLQRRARCPCGPSVRIQAGVQVTVSIYTTCNFILVLHCSHTSVWQLQLLYLHSHLHLGPLADAFVLLGGSPALEDVEDGGWFCCPDTGREFVPPPLFALSDGSTSRPADVEERSALSGLCGLISVWRWTGAVLLMALKASTIIWNRMWKPVEEGSHMGEFRKNVNEARCSVLDTSELWLVQITDVFICTRVFSFHETTRMTAVQSYSSEAKTPSWKRLKRLAELRSDSQSVYRNVQQTHVTMFSRPHVMFYLFIRRPGSPGCRRGCEEKQMVLCFMEKINWSVCTSRDQSITGHWVHPLVEPRWG